MAKAKEKQIADLSQICTRKKSCEGVWLPYTLCGQSTDIEVLVFGNDSDAVRRYEREQLKSRLSNFTIDKKSKNIGLEDDALESAIDDPAADALVRFGGIRRKGGEAIPFDGKDFPVQKDASNEPMFRELLEGSPDLQEFINSAAKDREAFLA